MKKKLLSLSVALCCVLTSNIIPQISAVTTDEIVQQSEEQKVFIVELENAPMAERVKKDNSQENPFNSDNTEAMKQELMDEHEQVKSLISENIPQVSFEGRKDFTVLINAFTVSATEEEARKISEIEGVKRVSEQNVVKQDTAKNNTVKRIATENSIQTMTLPETDTTTSVMDISEQYTGEGILVAILDTSMLTNHEAFSVAPQNPKYSMEDMQNLLTGSEMNVSENENYLDTVKSDKIIFAYDYADGDTDVFSADDVTGGHGCHVAGIVAGNNGEDFFGQARNAQIAFMKVMSDNSEYMTSEAEISALEDAVLIGADVINCSYGTTALYMQPDNPYNEIMQNIKNLGIIIDVAIGNEFNQFDLVEEGGLPYTDYIDYSMDNCPGNLPFCMGVGSFGYDEETDKYHASDFSSWGFTPDLKLKPDITTLGEQVLSSVNSSADAYEAWEGTSMATPRMAGYSAMMKEMLLTSEDSERFGKIINRDGLVNTINTVFMNTAELITDEENGLPVSPRKQGSGMVNISSALNADVYISVDGNETPKAEIGYSEDGMYSFSITIDNLSDTDKQMKLDTIINTDNYTYEEETGKYVDTLTPLGLDKTIITYLGTDENNTVSVPAGESANVTVSIELDRDDMEQLMQVFTNGFYVDGFLSITDEDNEYSVAISGFAGDWLKQSVFDEQGLLQPNGIFEIKEPGEDEEASTDFIDFGMGADGKLHPEKLSVSFMNEFVDSVAPAFFPIRNTLGGFSISLYDETGKELSNEYMDYSQQKVSYGLADYLILTKYGTDKKEEFEDGKTYTYEISASFEGDVLLNGIENARVHKSTVSFLVDNDKPVVEKFEYDKENNVINMTVSDNAYLGEILLQADGVLVYISSAEEIDPDISKGGSVEVTVDLSETECKYQYDLTISDYAGNSEVKTIRLAVAEPTLIGDLNLDDKFNISDLILLARYLVGADNYLTYQMVANADYNYDGNLNIMDMILMAKAIANVQ